MKTIAIKGTDETIYYEKLSNGLEVFMYPKETAKNFYLSFNVKFGSIDTEFKTEKDKKYTVVPNGIAHFLEHQMFQEDDNHTAFEYFDKLGSSINAFTTYNYTSYEVVASNSFKENLELLLDYVQNPCFKKSSVEKEKGIIKEEIKMYDNTPGAVLHYGMEYNLNQVDKHKYLISGTVDDIKEVTPEMLQLCYDNFYVPSNMFLVLTGKFSPLEALGIIKENQSTKTFAPKKKIIRKVDKEPLEPASAYEERTMDVSVPKLKLAYKLDKNKFKDYSDLEIKVYLDAILNIKFGPTSDLYEKLKEENLITFDLIPSRELRDDYIQITFETETEYKEQVIDLIEQELKNIKITSEELNRISKSNIASFILHFDDIIAVAMDLEDDILSSDKIEENIIDLYKKMDVDVANKMATLINAKHGTIFYINRNV